MSPPLYHFAPWMKVDPISTSTPRVPVTRGRPPWVVTTWPGTKPQVEVIIAAALSFHLGDRPLVFFVGWGTVFTAPVSFPNVRCGFCLFFFGGWGTFVVLLIAVTEKSITVSITMWMFGAHQLEAPMVGKMTTALLESITWNTPQHRTGKSGFSHRNEAENPVPPAVPLPGCNDITEIPQPAHVSTIFSILGYIQISYPFWTKPWLFPAWWEPILKAVVRFPPNQWSFVVNNAIGQWPFKDQDWKGRGQPWKRGLPKKCRRLLKKHGPLFSLSSHLNLHLQVSCWSLAFREKLGSNG